METMSPLHAAQYVDGDDDAAVAVFRGGVSAPGTPGTPAGSEGPRGAAGSVVRFWRAGFCAL
jgi:hypothetical protein